MKSRLFSPIFKTIVLAGFLFIGHLTIQAQSVSVPYGTPCVGSEMIFQFTGPGSCTSYSWSMNNATNGVHYTIVSGAGTSGLRVRWNAPVNNISATCTYSCSFGSSSRTSSSYNISNNVTPAVSIASSATNVCQGALVSFSPTPTNGGSSPSYQWQINGVNVSGATSNSFSTTSLNNGDQVRVQLTSNATCITSSYATSSPIAITVNTPTPQTITITSNKTSVCLGEGIEFRVASQSNVGTSPTYQWFVNGNLETSDVPQMGPQYFIKNQWNFSNNAQVTCKVSSTLTGCYSNNPATSAPIPISINSGSTFSVNISILPSKYPLTYCEDEIYFQANTSHPASTYYWTKNGDSEILGTGQTYNPVFFQQGDYVSVTAYVASTVCMSNTSDDSSTQGTPITMFTDLPGVAIFPSDGGSRCSAAGTTQFNFTGTIPSAYQWNLLNAGSSTINQSGLVTWASNFSGTASIEIRLVSCPSIFASKTYTVNPQPATPVAIVQTYCNFEFIQVTPAPNTNTVTFELYSSADVLLATGTEFSIGRKLNPGTYTYKLGALSSSGCSSPGKATITLSVTDNCDDKLNWIETTAFDNNNQIVGHSKSYFDYAGKPMQTQSKNFSNGKIFTSGIVKDQYDRIVASSLPAPTGSSTFKYDIRFMLNGAGTDVADADDLNTPQAFDESSLGRLGWYYSAGNMLEENTPTTKYPYSRTKYYEDGSGEVMMTTRPGEHHVLGSNHESLSGTFPVINELDDYLQLRNIVVLPGQTSYTTLMQQGVQNVVRDENGNYAISISDKSGKSLMAARPGNWFTVSNSVTLKRGDPLFMDRLYFYLLKPGPVTLTPAGSPPSYSIQNLITNQPYTIPPGNGDWAAGFYRIDVGSGTLGVGYSNSFEDVSYTFYNDAGRVVASISPNGFQQLKVNTPAVPYANIDKTIYTYNHRGWLLSMTEPDAGRTEYVYRSDGKIRFSQNALQRTQNRFSYTHYDELGRPVESGEYIGTAIGFKSVSMNGLIEVPASAITWPINDTKDWIRTHYDEPAAATLPTGYKQAFLAGAVSWTENKNTSTYYSYDEFGRVTWMWQKHEPILIPGGPTLSVGKSFLTEYQYNFLGNVLTVGNFTVEASGSITSTGKFYHHYEYDADQRLSKAYTSLDGSNRKLRASYSYYVHGPLKRVELGDQLQGIDFVYNIQGWLISINHPEQNSDPGGDGIINSEHASFKRDAFGMILDYYESSMSGLFQTSATHQKLDPAGFHKLPLWTSNSEKSSGINKHHAELIGSLEKMKADYKSQNN